MAAIANKEFFSIDKTWTHGKSPSLSSGQALNRGNRSRCVIAQHREVSLGSNHVEQTHMENLELSPLKKFQYGCPHPWDLGRAKVSDQSESQFKSKCGIDIRFYLNPYLRFQQPEYFSAFDSLGLPSAPKPVAQPPVIPLEPKKDQRRFFGRLAMGAGDLVASLSGVVSLVYNRVSSLRGSRDPVGIVALESATALGIVSGAYLTYDGYQEGYLSKKIGDGEGRVLAGIKMVKAAALTAGYMLLVPLRIFALTTQLPVSSVGSVLAKCFSISIRALFNGANALTALGSGMRVYQQLQFDQQLKSILNDTQYPQEKRAARVVAYWKHALTVTAAEKETIAQQLAGKQKFSALTVQQREEKVGRKARKLQLKKEQIFARCTNTACIERIRNATDIESDAIVKELQSHAKTNLTLNAIKLPFSVLVMISYVLAMFATGPIFLLIIEIINTSAMVGGFGLDIYELLEAFRDQVTGRYDHVYFMMSTLLGAVVVWLGLWISMNPIAFACAATFGMVWLGINVACIYRTRRLENNT